MMKNLEPEAFEAGENITDQVHKGKASGIVVSVRLTQEDSVRLVDLAEESGKTISQIARQAIRTFLSQYGQRPAFVPEITGGTVNVSIMAFAPLGPRSAKEGSAEVNNEPLTFRTGLVSAYN